MSLNEVFPHKFVINLDRRPDRFAEVTKEFEDVEIKDVLRWPAVDGTNLNNGYLNGGEVGILRSHLEIYKYCVDASIEQALIFEDDVAFFPLIKDFWPYYLQVPDDWQVLYLGGNHTQSTMTRIRPNVWRTTYSLALHAYAIKQRAMKQLLSMAKVEERQIDVYMGHLNAVVPSYFIAPVLAVQRDSYSDIQNQQIQYDCLHLGHPRFKRPN